MQGFWGRLTTWTLTPFIPTDTGPQVKKEKKCKEDF
jgi:hypothetical protein